MLDAVHTLALMGVRGIGPKAVRLASDLATHRPDGAEDLAALLDDVRASAPRTKTASLDEIEAALDAAVATVRDAERQGVGVAARSDGDYPPRLAAVDDAPPVLFWRGDVSAARADAVAVVGTRDPTDYGRRSARRLGQRLVESGLAVVSGLALGCDAEAHEGCLDASGRTVAVMAHGLDRVYPAAHEGLADRLLRDGGALVSEYAPGVRPQRRSFVARNRIQSGLSRAVVVVETSLRGGTMHTARFAVAQGRPVACVARPGGAPTSEGTAALVDAGDAVALDSEEAYGRFLARLYDHDGGRPGPDSAGEQADLFA